jgi:glycosyltransferase involved in cell wall biosynthesis
MKEERKMKIVVTGTRGIPNVLGGVETHCEELFPLIASAGYEVTLFRRKRYVQDELKEHKGIALIDIDTPKKKSFEAIIHTLKAVWRAKKLRADIIHIHAIGPALVTPFARLLGLKVVFTHHGPDYDRDKWGIAAKLMLRIGERMGVKFANEVIVISEVINSILKEKYNRTDAHLIYNGVPAPNVIATTNYLDELGIKSGKYIFAMGRFVPEKNFHQLIAAFSSLQEKEDYQLVLAGDTDFEDDYSRELKELAREKGVVLTGFIKGEKLHELLSHASAFVLPSSHEGLPISLLEAMSYDLPVIVSNIPANVEIELTPDSYFPVGDETELAKKLQKVIAEKPSKHKYLLDNYRWKTIAKQTITVYEKLQK